MAHTAEFPATRDRIAEVPIRELAETFGTPTYVYDLSVVGKRIDDLAAFDVIRYAQKANSNLAVLDYARRRGVRVDAVSAGEIARALAAGYRPGRQPTEIVYTADIFDRASLEAVVKYDLLCNLGSPDMIEQYGQAAPGRGIVLRINPGFGHGHSQKTNTGGPQSKHGIWHEQLPECVALAKRYDLRIVGLHMHIGSGTDFEHLAQVCGAMERIAVDYGIEVRSISAGGGLPIPYRVGQATIDLERYHAVWAETRDRLARRFGHPVELEIEPGRYLVAESGYLITEIRAVKRMGDNLFYLVDAGFNNLARPILYGAYHPISICPADGRASTDLVEAIVGGPLCESGDIFTQEEGGFVSRRSLPAAKVGDLLILERAGAYGAVMGSNYNSKPLAAEVTIDGGRPFLARRRQTLDEIMQGEAIPGR
ncbi:MAG TPA: diaminopimelate decarboxylase [Planctomycetaceae bacterium]|nr:diaminopimelate decarboxylase [Planctomycetaceae bacterium]HRF01460.1 diaminopimelate decarboxylase [Pirellulaceae bacterium]